MRKQNKKFDLLVLLSRVVLSLICLVLVLYTLISVIVVDVKGNRDDKLIEYRLAYVEFWNPYISYAFLVLSIILGTSIVLLIWRLKLKQKKMRQNGLTNHTQSKLADLVKLFQEKLNN